MSIPSPPGEAAIIREDAEPLPAATPGPLRWVIARLLAKDPADRYDSSRDLYRELRQIRERLSEATSASDVTPALGTPTRRSVRPWATLAGGLLVGASIAVWVAPEASSAASAPDLSRYTFTPVSTEEATESDPVWAPDGRSIAYSMSVDGLRQVFTRSVASSDAAQLTRGTTAAINPSWSPDGATIYFNSESSLWSPETARLMLSNTSGARM